MGVAEPHDHRSETGAAPKRARKSASRGGLKVVGKTPKVKITPPSERNKTSGLIGLFTTSYTDLSKRAKDIARGYDTP